MFWQAAHLRVGEVNVTFNVNPSCRTTASEIQFLQLYLRLIVSDIISSDIILAFSNHAIQFVYNVLGCGAFMEAQYSISALHEKRRSCRADLHECHAIIIIQQSISVGN